MVVSDPKQCLKFIHVWNYLTVASLWNQSVAKSPFTLASPLTAATLFLLALVIAIKYTH